MSKPTTSELETIYAKVRAGKDPVTGELLMTEADFTAAITSLSGEDK